MTLSKWLTLPEHLLINLDHQIRQSMRKSFVKYKVRQYCENCSSLSKRKIHPKQDPLCQQSMLIPTLLRLPFCLYALPFLSSCPNSTIIQHPNQFLPSPRKHFQSVSDFSLFHVSLALVIDTKEDINSDNLTCLLLFHVFPSCLLTQFKNIF